MGVRVKFAPEWSCDIVSGIWRFGVRRIDNPEPRGWAWRGMDNRFYWRVAMADSSRERGVSKTMDGARRAAVASARRMLSEASK